MLDPISTIGIASAAGAAACGFKVIRAHADQARREGVGKALRSIYEEVVGEPVPAVLTDAVQSLTGDKEPRQ